MMILNYVKMMIFEIRNYFYFLKVIRKQKNSKEWNRLNLRTDGVNKIATVVSLRDEDMGEEEGVRHFKATLLVKEHHDYLMKLDFGEIVSPIMRHIEGSQSYLLLYVFQFQYVNWLSISIVFSLISSLAGLGFYLCLK